MIENDMGLDDPVQCEGCSECFCVENLRYHRFFAQYLCDFCYESADEEEEREREYDRDIYNADYLDDWNYDYSEERGSEDFDD